MRFCLRAHATFEAENIDDAFIRLSKHFQDLVEQGVDGPDLFDSGEITITKCEQEVERRASGILGQVSSS